MVLVGSQNETCSGTQKCTGTDRTTKFFEHSPLWSRWYVFLTHVYADVINAILLFQGPIILGMLQRLLLWLKFSSILIFCHKLRKCVIPKRLQPISQRNFLRWCGLENLLFICCIYQFNLSQKSS